MHALGIPTTRARWRWRPPASRSTARPLPGAVLTRVAASHLRVGTFQFFASRGDLEALRRLVDYTIARHDPELAGTPDAPLALLRAVAQRQAALIAQWMNVGFIHGVMNTDNMTISGETIDYGPAPSWKPTTRPRCSAASTTAGATPTATSPTSRAGTGAAEALLPLLADADDEAAVQRVVAQAMEGDRRSSRRGTRPRLASGSALLGLADARDGDAALVADWLALLTRSAPTSSQTWPALLDDAPRGREAPPFTAGRAASADAWLARWRERGARCNAPGAVNPHRAAQPACREALASATEGDLAPFEQLLAALRKPFDDAPELAPYAEPAPAEITAGYQTFCGTRVEAHRRSARWRA